MNFYIHRAYININYKGEIMIDSRQVLNYLSLNKKRLQQEYHLTKIGVFGSIARNDQNNNSDIDLIIEFEEKTPDLYEIKKKIRAEITQEFNVRVDICREKYIKPIFKDQIMSEVKYV